MAEKCKECGCMCARCTQNAHLSDMHLHAEIENLRQRLMERDSHIVTMETQFLNEADKFPNGELASIKEEILMWQDKYTRLHDAHKRVQKVNQNLEDKLLRIVDKCETEKGAFTKDIATLSHRLADANYTIHRLTQDNERYRSDVSLAIQLLQCKPSNFVGQKYESLPSEVQAKVRSYVSQKRRSSDVSAPETKSIRVPISTFPPTAMVFNISKTNSDKHSDDDDSDDKPPIDVISAAIMAKVLEDREKERIFAKHCDTCTCHRSILAVDAETQTLHDPSTEKSRDTLTKCDKTTMNSYESSTTTCFSKNDTKNLDYSKHDKGYLNMKNVKRQAGKKPSFPHSKNSEKQSSKQIGNSNTSQSQIDIINDRLWKNGWHKVPEKSSSNDETEIDVINNRIWKNDKSKSKDSQLTVIEVRNAESRESIPLMANETSATSPSFSSDSVVISTSDPSSSSSDALIQCIGEKQRLYNHKSNSSLHEKGMTGRNCLMRVTPGSKNILLDNAGHYETVLYTSGSYRANTALVHSGKSRTGRSASTSSDESAAVLPHDNTQLQRVAEWVQSSINRDNSTIGKCVDSSVDQMNGSNRSKAKDLMGSDFPNEGGETEKKPIGSQDSSKDLITFDVTNDEKVDKRSVNKKASMDYDIKITKEMEETYLKLAASLDPVALSLSSSTTDLTIEKYRKDHKRLQKTLDKSGSSG